MWLLLLLLSSAAGSPREPSLVRDYFVHKDAKHVVYLTCKSSAEYKAIARSLISAGIRMAVGRIDQDSIDLGRLLRQRDSAVGALLDGACNNTQATLIDASELTLLDAVHPWLVLKDGCDDSYEEQFGELSLCVDADLAVASHCEGEYRLTDVFNFGRMQGNRLETTALGSWAPDTGLEITLHGFKYYNRWDFHNLTLRAVSVIKGSPKVYDEADLSSLGYSEGVNAITKTSSKVLNVIKEMHNFRLNYTIAGQWIGTTEKNSTPAVSNTLFWREQDISSTALRLFPARLQWVEFFGPPVAVLESHFYYIISDHGVGDYENRFLTPMSPAVWWSIAAVGLVCAVVLVAAAAREKRPEPGYYGFFSVLAAGFQQDYEDGAQAEHDSSQSRRLALLVVGLTSMLLYNYYTSSVVSWLLSAAPPTLATLDALINSDFELIFEDIGYTRGWLANPGFFYYSGFINPKEDEMRSKKVITNKRTVPVMQSVEDGIAMVRTGKFAYHVEPYTATQVISRTYVDSELCRLGVLKMIPAAPAYLVGQRSSPYKQFFVWSLMRLQERGHLQKIQAQVEGATPTCSGSTPRALSLGQAAPAFLLLAEGLMLAVIMLAWEIWCHRYKQRITATI